jgi:hypothetical protein
MAGKDKKKRVDEAVKADEAFEELIEIKYNRMLESEQSRSYAKQLVQDLSIGSPDGAFLVGAIDAMIYNMAVSLEFEELQSGEYRKKLIERLWKKNKPHFK